MTETADLASLESREVWDLFFHICSIPHPSHHEEALAVWVLERARGRGLAASRDAAGNVIIRKPARAGREGAPGVIIQAHLDMVPQKNSSSSHDFLKDPIRPRLDPADPTWLYATGTTLGADNGIGVAAGLALLEDPDLDHGPLELLLTVNEEDGFTGINALSPDVLVGRKLINLDNELEGQILISSAGGVYVNVQATYVEVATPGGMTGLQVTIDGLVGGHSGADINKGRGSAHQLMARLLVEAPASLGLRLASLVGGNLSNAIPRATSVVVALPTEQAAAFGVYLDDFGATVAGELADSDPGVAVKATAIDLPAKVMEDSAQADLIGAVYDAPQGVFAMSADVPGLVETSGNIGVLSIGAGQFVATVYVRSAVDLQRDAEAERFATVFEEAGATVTIEGAYSSWPPNTDSALLAIMKQAYLDLYGVAASVAAIHAGLECSVAGVKYPGIDMISVGPTTQSVHSPDERLEVASVPKVYDQVVAALGDIK